MSETSVPASCELAVIGGGPAGLGAATLAAELGLDVVLLDEQGVPGGQIYRNVEGNQARQGALELLGEDYAGGAGLVDAFRRSAAAYLPGSTVWQADGAGEIGILRAGAASLVRTRRLVIATGALERPVPIPGWTLPGVMGAGAAQTLLKSSAMVPQGRTVIAGSGPLVYLIALQLSRAGVDLAGVLLTTPPGRRRAALGGLPRAMLSGSYLWKGLGWMKELRRRSVPVRSGISGLAAEGEGRLRAVRFEEDGREQRLEADLLLLHAGVVPNVQLSMAAGCAHAWDAGQHCWHPVTDAWGATDVPSIAVAGDGAGVLGARAAHSLGRLAALDAALRLERIGREERDRRAEAEQRTLARERRVRPFLDRLFEPAAPMRYPTGDGDLLCRCEEVTAGEIRTVLAQGCVGPNQVKSFTRCGMGPCQGRMCGLALSEFIAAERDKPVAEVGYYRLRYPVKSLTVGELAGVANIGREPVASVEMPTRPPEEAGDGTRSAP